MQILIALVLAVITGLLLGAYASTQEELINHLAIPCELVLKALRALATPLILLAVLHAFMTTEIPGRSGRKLVWLLLTNTLMAIFIGLMVANILKPGTWGQMAPPSGTMATNKTLDPWSLLRDTIPESILKPLNDNNVIQLIVVALAFGIALRGLKAIQTEQGRSQYREIARSTPVLAISNSCQIILIG